MDQLVYDLPFNMEQSVYQDIFVVINQSMGPPAKYIKKMTADRNSKKRRTHQLSPTLREDRRFMN